MRRSFGRRAATAFAVVTAGALALSGCFGGNGGSGGSGEPGDERISIAMMQPPKSALNPFSDDAQKLSRLSFGEGLAALDDDLEVQPALATEWEQVDARTWVFTLREGVKFHDGTDFGPEAVKNTLDQAVQASPPPRVLNGVTITSVDVTGDSEVTIVTEDADPILPYRLASPQLSILAAAAYKDDGTISPIETGTGPFVLTETDDTTTATLERFDDYWGETAIAAGLDVSFVPDGTARAGAIRSGSADVAETIPVSQISLLDESMVNQVYMPRSTFMTLNSESGPFADPAVRAAARAAIDPQKLVDGVYEGNADISVGLLGPAIPWAEDLRGDVDSAAAPADVNGIEITLATYTDRAENPEIAVQLEKQLEDAGFIVKQDVREYVNMEKDMLAGAFDAVIVSRNTLLDTGDSLSFLAQDFSCDGGYNIAQLCDADLDALIGTSMNLAVGPERQQATMDVEAAILRLDAAVPLVHERVVQGELGTWVDFVRDPLERRLVTNLTKPAN